MQAHRLKWKFLKLNAKIKNDKFNWAYINFLQTEEVIILPTFGIDEDKQAYQQFKQFFSKYAANDKILQIDCNEIVRNGGALNCITWNIIT